MTEEPRRCQWDAALVISVAILAAAYRPELLVGIAVLIFAMWLS